MPFYGRCGYIVMILHVFRGFKPNPYEIMRKAEELVMEEKEQVEAMNKFMKRDLNRS